MNNDFCREQLYLEHSAKDRLDKIRSGALKYGTAAQRIHEEAVNTAQKGIEKGVNAVKNAPSALRTAGRKYSTAAQRVHEEAVNVAQRGITPLGDAVRNTASKARMAWNTASDEFKQWKKDYNHHYYETHKDLWDKYKDAARTGALKYSTAAQRIHEEAVNTAQRGIEKGVGTLKDIHGEAVNVAQRGIENGVDTIKGIHKEAVDVAEQKMEPYLDKAREAATNLSNAAKAKVKGAVESAAKRAITAVKDIATNPETYKVISDVGKSIGQSIASEIKNTDFSSLGRDILSAIKQGLGQ